MEMGAQGWLGPSPPPCSVFTTLHKRFLGKNANDCGLTVDGETKASGAWYHAEPKPAVASVEDHFAFSNSVAVEC